MYILIKAGGMASTGKIPILDIGKIRRKKILFWLNSMCYYLCFIEKFYVLNLSHIFIEFLTVTFFFILAFISKN